MIPPVARIENIRSWWPHIWRLPREVAFVLSTNPPTSTTVHSHPHSSTRAVDESCALPAGCAFSARMALGVGRDVGWMRGGRSSTVGVWNGGWFIHPCPAGSAFFSIMAAPLSPKGRRTKTSEEREKRNLLRLQSISKACISLTEEPVRK